MVCHILLGIIILFLGKQVRTKENKSQYITEFMTLESLKKVKLSCITFENGKILSKPLPLLILISAVNICGAVALQAANEEAS